jgi:hypothetical protein
MAHETQFDTALRLLDGRLALAGPDHFDLVVCGGTALVAMGFAERATRDVDVVALADNEGRLIDPAPLPALLLRAAMEVAEDLSLQNDWLNNGPSSGDGGLFRLGLPDGFALRLTWRRYGSRVTVGFASRVDQIHFKLYAAVDQSGGYHAADLLALTPTDSELLAAAAWTRSHDPSAGFHASLKRFLQEFGHASLADRV